MNATASIPIVALDLESDPLPERYVRSLARRGGNVTGMFLDIPELSAKQLGMLKKIVPRLSRGNGPHWPKFTDVGRCPHITSVE